ncbi:hypothetical protein QBC41DRAFT_307295 [Cercophora samala]|uniref:Xylanolytic transcriptional activator regulatory domain-containing protein n=1 Tax=Cercophora samala TaxID=330535 RepID=A0AA40D5T9_9PEZI|nr:hypothetical protein QBC41DRAFT_307295 [Cercophora samala]
MATPPSHRPLRALLPADTEGAGGERGAVVSSASSSVGPRQTSVELAPRRRTARAACIECRKRKTKARNRRHGNGCPSCTAERPRCNECTRRNSDCEYDAGGDETPGKALKRRFVDLEDKVNIYEQVYAILRSRPQHEANSVFKRIRTGDDPRSILRHVEHGDLLLQLRVVPESRYRYEFPFMSPLPSWLQTQDNPYLESLIYEWELERPRSPIKSPKRKARQVEDRRSESEESTTPGPGPYLKPFHAAEVHDSLIDSTEPSKWTAVTTDNTLLRSLLRSYFLHEYQWFSAFQKDYFLDDMVKDRRQFCSPLLVNAVLALACHTHRELPDRAEYWNPRTLGYGFLTEAKRHWELEQAGGRNKLTTIQAAIILNLVYNLNAMVKLGWRYTIQAVDMAHKMKLFKKPENWETLDSKVRAGRDFTAWSLFGWQSHCAYHLLEKPLVDNPPEVPLPDVAANPRWYGEVFLKYPLETILYPSHYAELHKAKTEFRTILNDVSKTFYGEPGQNRPPPVEPKIAELYWRLQAWYTALPESLSPKTIVFTAQMKLHMHYHHVIITMLQSLMARSPAASTSSSTASPTPPVAPTPPQNVLAISSLLNSDPPSEPPGPTLPPLQATFSLHRTQYETLLRLYYLRHGFEALDTFIMVALMTMAFITTKELEDIRRSAQVSSEQQKAHIDSLRATLVLCTKGLYDQGKSYYLSQTIFRLIRNGMHVDEKELLREYAALPDEEDSEDARMREELAQRLWPHPHPTPQSDSQEDVDMDYAHKTAAEEQDGWRVLDGLLKKYGGVTMDAPESGDSEDQG